MNNANQTGVTLIELMIVVAVISILAAIAYPSYRQSIVRSNRTEARNELNRYAGELEKCFTLFNIYNYNVGTHNCKTLQTTLGGTGYLGQQRKYQITGVINASNFTLTATPQGAQAADTECGNLTLTDTNVRDKSGTGTATACWK